MASATRPLDGRTILITGATSGIGLEAARELARQGALVAVGARDPRRGQAVVDELARAGGRAELFVADVSHLGPLRGAAERFAAAHPRLDVLVNNAGVAARARTVTDEGHELTWATNVLAPVLLARALLPSLRAAPGARVVNVASEAHRGGRMAWDDLALARGYSAWRAYTQSKLALVLLTRELARREPGVAVNAVHPGAIATRIWRDVPQPVRALLGLFLPGSRKGAAPVVKLAADPALAGVTGRYFDRLEEKEPSAPGQDDGAAARLWGIVEPVTA